MKIPTPDHFGDAIIQEVKMLFGSKPETFHFPPSDNYVWRLSIGSSKRKVIKIGAKFPARLEREVIVLRQLEERGIRTVEVVCSGRFLLGRPYFISSYIGDWNLQEACHRNEHWASEACFLTGRSLALMAGSVSLASLPLLPGGVATRDRDLERAESTAGFFDGSDREILKVIDSAREYLEADHTHFTHRDFSPRQVVCSDNFEPTIIDWESAGPGRTWRDIGDFIGGLVKFSGSRPRHIEAFLDGVHEILPIGAAERREIRTHFLYSLLWASVIHLRKGDSKTGRSFLDTFRSSTHKNEHLTKRWRTTI